ncbi:uncharacterized protein ACLA_027390 [Aspergillus clavatus NRRL 1]|uniref:Aminoglycoside phosphotransferase domain-containing protein n=1 Tax=Aspergillus clavatus (strain ATCC 1007 / CBS 513.65 / DSM 816 / NCTC 3887 / NRRL 1 / QM 1276 / 107) TaxID=344612 RepID=A1CQU6_ASPCL|nr:uncharacterized protein ACLA_027390 [Aspergillus clavatus NRRL 1]EAW08017.1 conserved hypothetical protein [Aspergillus clavatus NRRL 1]
MSKEAADQDILALVSQEVSQTPYACSTLTQLSGGTANFVYRGILSRPLEDGTKTIIIKHGEAYAASNRDFKLPTERCVIEETILSALNNVPATAAEPENTGTSTSTSTPRCTVRTPHLFHFNRATNTQILEDLPDALDLKTFMLAPAAAHRVPHDLATVIGRAVGKWLRAFHDWVAEASQGALAQASEKNKLMRDLKFTVNYNNLVGQAGRFPALLAESQPVFRRVRDMAAAELGGTEGEGFGVIHGDFWSGNVLIPGTALDQQLDVPLFVTDWELCQYGPRALDLGQMIAELYELKHFKDIDAGIWIIEGLAEGYGVIDEDMAFRTAIHVGVHLICWGSTVAGWGTDEQIEEVVKIGRDLVVRGWEKDRAWFEGIWLRGLFTRA